MRLQLIKLIPAIAMIVLFAQCDIRGLLFGDEGPLGTSSMSATINNDLVAFTDIRPSMYFHFSVSATSPNYNILLCIGGGSVGQYQWKMRPCQDLEADTSASLNSKLALPGTGGCTITRSDNVKRLVEGTFSFTVIDTVQQDTIRVNEGVFSLYYPSEG